MMAWRRIGDKPFSEPKLTRFTDIYMALGEDELNMTNNADKEHFKQSVECKRLFLSTDLSNTQYK